MLERFKAKYRLNAVVTRCVFSEVIFPNEVNRPGFAGGWFG
jgi:hypothetical protein